MIQPEELLQELGPEPWGHRIARARQSRGLTLDQVASMANEILPVSYGPFQRLERLATPPDNRKSRMWADVVVLLCGYRPEEFELSMADVPEAIRHAAIARCVLNRPGPRTPAEQDVAQSRCTVRPLRPIVADPLAGLLRASGQ